MARAFTLIEILVTMVILAIAALVVVPMMSSAGGMQVMAAADQLAADMEYARSMAISRGRFYAVVFDPDTDARCYRLVEVQTGAVLQHPVNIGHDYVVSFAADSRFGQVTFDEADFDGGTVNDDGLPEVRFDALGSPYNAEGNPLNAGHIRLRAGEVTRTVRIEPVTGLLSISD